MQEKPSSVQGRGSGSYVTLEQAWNIFKYRGRNRNAAMQSDVREWRVPWWQKAKMRQAPAEMAIETRVAEKLLKDFLRWNQLQGTTKKLQRAYSYYQYNPNDRLQLAKTVREEGQIFLEATQTLPFPPNIEEVEDEYQNVHRILVLHAAKYPSIYRAKKSRKRDKKFISAVKKILSRR